MTCVRKYDNYLLVHNSLTCMSRAAVCLPCVEKGVQEGAFCVEITQVPPRTTCSKGVRRVFSGQKLLKCFCESRHLLAMRRARDSKRRFLGRNYSNAFMSQPICSAPKAFMNHAICMPCVEQGGQEGTFWAEITQTPHFAGRVMLPSLTTDGGPVYVNAKQYDGIMWRKRCRARDEQKNKDIKTCKPYLHESPHFHSMPQARGSRGRFLGRNHSNGGNSYSLSGSEVNNNILHHNNNAPTISLVPDLI